MTEPTKCPRCGTEGCPTSEKDLWSRWNNNSDRLLGDMACSQRAQTELLRKLIGMVAGCMSNGCLDVTLR
jgi:hypothetical protein